MNLSIKGWERITVFDELIHSLRTLQKPVKGRLTGQNHRSASLLDQRGITHKLKRIPQALLGV
jgi:hypothetical protein